MAACNKTKNNNLKAATMNSTQLPRSKAAATKIAAFNLLFEWLKLQAATCTSPPIVLTCCWVLWYFFFVTSVSLLKLTVRKYYRKPLLLACPTTQWSSVVLVFCLVTQWF